MAPAITSAGACWKTAPPPVGWKTAASKSETDPKLAGASKTILETSVPPKTIRMIDVLMAVGY